MVWSHKIYPKLLEETLKGYNTEDNILSEEKSQCGNEANGKFIPLNSVTAKFSPPTSKRLLSNKFDIDDQNIWSSVYLLPASVTLDTKIRMFQYKILDNILYLNQRLYCMNFVESPLCSLYKREVESISHLFSTRLWAETQRWCSPAIARPQLTEKIVYLGWFSNSPQTILINLILLLYKYFLYCKRNERINVNFNAFKFYIRYIVKIEESTAKRKNNLKAHFSKWDPLKGLIS